MFGLYEPSYGQSGNLAEPQQKPAGVPDSTIYWRDSLLHAHYEPPAMNRQYRKLLFGSARGGPARRHRRYRALFTLLELLVSLGIILILATLTMRLLNATLNSDRIRNGAREFQSFLAGRDPPRFTPASLAVCG